MKTIEQALKFIEESHGRIFSIKFLKRGTTELREMTCRTDVKKYVKGEGRAYNPAEHLLVYVYDMLKKGYRCFPIDGLKEIKIDGEWHRIVTPEVMKKET